MIATIPPQHVVITEYYGTAPSMKSSTSLLKLSRSCFVINQRQSLYTSALSGHLLEQSEFTSCYSIGHPTNLSDFYRFISRGLRLNPLGLCQQAPRNLRYRLAPPQIIAIEPTSLNDFRCFNFYV